MEVHFPTDLEEKLTNSAAKQGRKPGDLVQDLVARHFEQRARYADALPDDENASSKGQQLTNQQAAPVAELPVWHLGDTGPLHRRDIYDDVC